MSHRELVRAKHSNSSVSDGFEATRTRKAFCAWLSSERKVSDVPVFVRWTCSLRPKRGRRWGTGGHRRSPGTAAVQPLARDRLSLNPSRGAAVSRVCPPCKPVHGSVYLLRLGADLPPRALLLTRVHPTGTGRSSAARNGLAVTPAGRSRSPQTGISNMHGPGYRSVPAAGPSVMLPCRWTMNSRSGLGALSCRAEPCRAVP